MDPKTEKTEHYTVYTDAVNVKSFYGDRFSYRQYVPDDTACGVLLVRIRELCIEKNYKLNSEFKHGDEKGYRKWSVGRYILIDLNQKCRAPFWAKTSIDLTHLPVYKTNFCNIVSHTYRSKHFEELMWLVVALEKQKIDFIVAEPLHPKEVFRDAYGLMIEKAYDNTLNEPV